MIAGKWNRERTSAAVKAVLAVKPPRGYEKLFAVEKLQEMAAAGQSSSPGRPPAGPGFTGVTRKLPKAGQDPNEATRLAV